mgnify:CR=1 FL=1
MQAIRYEAPGSVDEAVRLNPALEAFIAQDKGERASLAEGYARLAAILAGAPQNRP